MSLDRLWAGWRGEYVTGAGAGGPADVESGPGPAPDVTTIDRGTEVRPEADDPARCVFCRIAASGPPSADNGVLWMGETTYAVLNAYPYASGHLMVLPIRHVGTIGELTDQEGADLWAALRQGVSALESALEPEGINLGANLGRAAGAGIPRHLHLHAVPRWVGDTNFMTAVAGTRVLPETLAVTWTRLHRAWPG